jgi:hypothetical protein
MVQGPTNPPPRSPTLGLAEGGAVLSAFEKCTSANKPQWTAWMMSHN